MAKIHVMDDILANKIAAGEVVERCMNVVKELVENSIDANSTEIKIDLIDSGIKEITVIDNGVGMDKEDALLAFKRHATSKLFDEDDLFNINTLGFRGEALPSIASVSKVLLKTSTGKVGTKIVIEGGKLIENSKGDARRGTSITVKDLFYNTPARLKHMKSLYTELASITDYVDKIALSNPDIKFILTNNGNTLLNTDGNNNLLKTIKEIYGLSIVKRMIPVEASDNDYEITGYISLPEIHRSNRNGMITLVNGRVVRNINLNRVINDSYHSFKPDNRYPIVVLNITVDPSLVDVNVHPTKMDIKFSKFEELCNLISDMIKDILHKKTLIPHIEQNTEEKEKTINHYEEMTLDLNRVVENRISEEENPYSKVEEKLTINNDYIIKNSDENTKEEIIKENEIDYINNVVEEKKERLPEMYPVGLVHGTYIICQNEQGMYLIDEHAAKERCNYEKFMYMMGHPTKESIGLLFPLTIELSNSDFVIIKHNFDLLKSLNFNVEENGVNSIVIKSHPTWIPNGIEEETIRKIIEVIIRHENDFSITKFNEGIATMMSCKKAIKANTNITLAEMEQIISDLRKCDNPFNCPHGRPTIVYYSKYDIEKMFKRTGF